MIIKRIGNGEYYEEPLIEGSKVTVKGQEIDVLELQEDGQKIVDIKEGDFLLASIHIPPREYVTEEMQEETMNQEGQVVFTPVALDLNAVEICLWPVNQNEEPNEAEE